MIPHGEIVSDIAPWLRYSNPGLVLSCLEPKQSWIRLVIMEIEIIWNDWNTETRTIRLVLRSI